jgi:hypothetical protein
MDLWAIYDTSIMDITFLKFCLPCIVVYQYSETNVMHIYSIY